MKCLISIIVLRGKFAVKNTFEKYSEYINIWLDKNI